jgi:probable rRNA maturation factor
MWMSNSRPSIDVNIEAGNWAKALPDAAMLVERAVWAACAALDGVPAHAEVSVLLTDDAHQRILNRDWRGKDKPTNVLSFPGDDVDHAPADAPVLLGDIAVAFETTAAEARDQQKSLADHFCHLLVHGMLHLLGFDHETEPQADEMEPLEIEILAGLGIASPYPDRHARL